MLFVCFVFTLGLFLFVFSETVNSEGSREGRRIWFSRWKGRIPHWEMCGSEKTGIRCELKGGGGGMRRQDRYVLELAGANRNQRALGVLVKALSETYI